MPARLHVSGLPSTVTRVQFSLFDAAGNETGITSVAATNVPGVGTQFIYSGNFAAGQRYQYVAFDANNNFVTAVHGTIGP